MAITKAYHASALAPGATKAVNPSTTETVYPRSQVAYGSWGLRLRGHVLPAQGADSLYPSKNGEQRQGTEIVTRQRGQDREIGLVYHRQVGQQSGTPAYQRLGGRCEFGG